jgi:hypothetical protein
VIVRLAGSIASMVAAAFVVSDAIAIGGASIDADAAGFLFAHDDVSAQTPTTKAQMVIVLRNRMNLLLRLGVFIVRARALVIGQNRNYR